jgi:hypothetical protein
VLQARQKKVFEFRVDLESVFELDGVEPQRKCQTRHVAGDKVLWKKPPYLSVARATNTHFSILGNLTYQSTQESQNISLFGHIGRQLR